MTLFVPQRTATMFHERTRAVTRVLLVVLCCPRHSCTGLIGCLCLLPLPVYTVSGEGLASAWRTAALLCEFHKVKDLA